MEETVNFQKKRQEFLGKNKVEIDVLEFMKEPRRVTKEREVYTSPKAQLKTVKRKSKKKASQRLTKRLGTIGLAGLIAFGGLTAYSNYKEENTPITLEQALNNGENLEELKIDELIESELKEIKEKLGNENMSNYELISLSTEINDLQFDTLKTKLAKTLEVEESDITLHTRLISSDGETSQTVKVKDIKATYGQEIYGNKGFFTNKNTISDEIAQYIENIGDMQNLMGDIQSGDIDRDYILNEYKKAVKEIDQMAAAKMSVDEKGNITVDQTKVKELKENNKEDNKEVKTQEEDIER